MHLLISPEGMLQIKFCKKIRAQHEKLHQTCCFQVSLSFRKKVRKMSPFDLEKFNISSQPKFPGPVFAEKEGIFHNISIAYSKIEP